MGWSLMRSKMDIFNFEKNHPMRIQKKKRKEKRSAEIKKEEDLEEIYTLLPGCHNNSPSVAVAVRRRRRWVVEKERE